STVHPAEPSTRGISTAASRAGRSRSARNSGVTGPSASARSRVVGSSALDAALRELGRIEQGREPLRRKVGIFGGDVADRAAFFVRALRDRRALLVADDR